MCNDTEKLYTWTKALDTLEVLREVFVARIY